MGKPKLSKAQRRLLQDMKDGTPLLPIRGSCDYTIKGRRVRYNTVESLASSYWGRGLLCPALVLSEKGKDAAAALEGDKP